MMAVRRFVAGLMVVATIVGVVALQRSRPVQSSPAEFSQLGSATMPFVPKGRLRHVGVVLRGCAGRRPAARRYQRSSPTRPRSALTGSITTYTDAPESPRYRAFEVPRTRHASPSTSPRCSRKARSSPRWSRSTAVVDSSSSVPTARRQRGVAVLELDVVHVVLRRRLHGRGQQGRPRHHQSIPVRRDRQHSRGDRHRERTPADPAGCPCRPSVLVVSQDLLANERRCRRSRSRAHAAGWWSVAPRSTSRRSAEPVSR